ncbi:hypothetical protein ACFPOD_04775 [Nitratireductor kimnyeongensis]|uniref:Uncharacterized protein n=1 Tax=Nitratireductor kimnyeongensis TaxID=430679 RepID=A0ABW0T641_9HYPH|nr:hypothetical protein [Nitratireductor kimnyeongensis]QZZ34600.1 hypothetical protein KW403_12420 [Nitratireductor kimnyeongensis]
MSEIPEDIEVMAQAELDKGEMAIVTVARAILAERKRCAEICERIEHTGGGIEHAADAIMGEIDIP